MGGCESKQDRALNKAIRAKMAAQAEAVAQLDNDALARELAESREACRQSSRSFRSRQSFNSVQKHSAAQAQALGVDAAEQMIPYQADELNRLEHLETKCALLERVLQLPRSERDDPTAVVEETGLAFSKYHDVYADLTARIDAIRASRDDLIAKWVASGGADAQLEQRILDWEELHALAARVDVDAHL